MSGQVTPPGTHVLKRGGSNIPQFTRRIPQDIKPRLVGRTWMIAFDEGEIAIVKVTKATQSIRFSLRTEVPRIAASRLLNANARVDAIFGEIRQEARTDLNHKQVLALAGEFYREVAAEPGQEPRQELVPSEYRSLLTAPMNLADYPEFATKLEALSDTVRGKAVVGGDSYLLETYGDAAEWLLAKRGLGPPAPNTKLALVRLLDKALADGLRVRARYASGDYNEDENLKRYPAWQDSRSTFKRANVSLNDILEGWWFEAKAAGVTISTYEGYSNTIRLLTEFLGHDDATAVTLANIVDFKDFRLRSTNPRTGKPISPKTVKGSDLSAINTIFKWAAGNGKVLSNPAYGVTIKVGKKPRVREREFTRTEAMALLNAASGITDPKNQTEMAIRWVPWLCAYTGCRVGEAVQLRREDVRFDEDTGSWIMRITPEAGTVKTKEFRDAPLHPHIIEQGFIEQCVRNNVLAPSSPYLFMTIKANSTLRGVWQSKKNRIQEFARTIITDPNVAPNHAWRHTFKSVGFEVGIQEKVLDAICGHAQATTGREYGSVTLRTKVEGLKLFPRWE